jgi:UDP-glucose 4-epimerase
MRVLITGTSGRIGQAIAACLGKATQLQVTGLDLVSGPWTTTVGSICDQKVMARALQGCDAVIHTAALHAPHVDRHSEQAFQQTNVDAVAQLLALCRMQNIRRLVYTSTTALYGHANTLPDRAAWLDEETPAQPRTIYHQTKLAAEMLIEAAVANGHLDATILRMSRCFPEPIPMLAVYRLHRGIDARDVAQAHRVALERVKGLQRYIVSAATPFTRADLAMLYADAPRVIAAREPELVSAFATHAWPLPLSIDRVYDAARMHRALGWRSQFGWQSVIDSVL